MAATQLSVIDGDGQSSFQDRGRQVTLTFADASCDTATTTVEGCPWVTADTVFGLSPVGSSTRSAFEALLCGVSFAIDNVVAGVGFDVVAYASSGASGSFVVHVVGV